MTNIKKFLSRAWAMFSALDARLKNSAFAGIFITILTGVIIGLPGFFKSDDKPGPEPNISRALYETKVAQQACGEDKFSVMLTSANNRVLALAEGGLTPDEKVDVILIWADLVRAARPLAADMAKELEGITPPKQYAADHAEMIGAIQVYQKVIDDLDRALPAELSRSPQALANDPKLDQRLSDTGNVWKGAAAALKSTTYSSTFAAVHVCPTSPVVPKPPPVVPSATATPFSLLPTATPTPFRFTASPVATLTFRDVLATPTPTRR